MNQTAKLTEKKNHNKGLFDQIQETVEFLKANGFDKTPDLALIFGSGLGAIAGGMEVDCEVDYADIPGFVTTTLDFHKGRLLIGRIGDRCAVAMDGRFHSYEGYTMQQITYPVRIMRALGAKILLLSNISGGLNPEFSAGDIVIITDHINLMGGSPLIGENDERIGPRFPDMIEPYSRRLIEIAEKHAMSLGYHLQRGVYLALSGPAFETRAEYRMIRMMGGDMVGMSSVPEVIAAVHGGMEILGLSLISDECFPECLESLDIRLLLERADNGSKIIGSIFQSVIGDSRFLSS